MLQSSKGPISHLIHEKTFRSYVMNGGPLSSNPYLSYKPQCSFDENGFLKSDLMPDSAIDDSFSFDDSSDYLGVSVSFCSHL